jgi:hypothetical protein
MTAPSEDAPSTVKVMRLRYAGTCRGCGTALDAGVTAAYDRVTRTVSCMPCHEGRATATEPLPVRTGTPGASARREFERRAAKREDRIRTAHPRLGGLILALSEEPQSTTAWARGARGEELLGTALDGLTERGVRLLHDRRIPRSRANIDHIAVAPSGVHVIDAKRYRGRPTLRVEGGILRPRVEKLLVGGRNCTPLVAGVQKQVGVVADVLDAAGMGDVPVHGVLCFVDADWPLIGGTFVTGGVAVLWPRKLGDRLRAEAPLGQAGVDAAHRALARALPEA